ncbi:MAG: alpha/beta hydrolase [Bifidobacteriaceae bacterium]|jgi:pimeloyl-ACP methyl ester carboxylesterase|nr:alpha/beta hydrolase [Bifidobacteriaceae bacterium]
MQIGVTQYRAGSSNAVPLILIHGFPVDHRMWDAAAEALTQLTAPTTGSATNSDSETPSPDLSRVPIFAFEMPGAGATPVPEHGEFGPVAADGAYPDALDDMATAMVEQLNALGFSKAIWVGLSMGGYVAFAIQRLFPKAVAGLGICDSKTDADSAESRANRLRVAQEAEDGAGWRTVMHFAEPGPKDSMVKKSTEFITTFIDWIHDQTPEGIAWRQRMAAGRPDQADVLSTIDVPTLLLSGELDPSSPPEKMRPYVSRIPGVRGVPRAFLVEVPDAGHFTAVEQPTKTAAALVELLERVAAASSRS